MKKKIKLIFTFTLILTDLFGQSIDKIEAILGEEIILTSEIESQYAQFLSQGNNRSPEIKCQIIDDLLFQKLLINQAKIDSIDISNDEIDSEVNKRISYFINQLGSIKKVESYFGKLKNEIELELSRVVKDQILAQKMQKKLTSSIKITPSEVKSEFNKLTTEELPEIPTQVEISQIVIKPQITLQQKDEIKLKLENFRLRINNGEDFKMLAALYSDDPGSAAKGGELGFVNRGDLVPNFERAAFRLKEGEISKVIESEYGYHIIQLIERRGEQINVRHILLKTKVNSTELYLAKLKIDSIFILINNNKISFNNAVKQYSDPESKINNGLLINKNTMSALHTLEELSPSLKIVIKDMSIDEVSEPKLIQLEGENKAYRIIKINRKIEAHNANLVDDFSIIKEFAINSKKQEQLDKWTNKTIANTYINLSKSIKDCEFANKWKK